VLLSLEVARGCHTKRGRHRGSRVAGPELVVLTLAALEEAGDAIPLTEGRELLVAPGQQLPGIRLMPDIPDDLVPGRLEFV